MESFQSESEFWSTTIEEYELANKLETIVSDPCASWPKIARISNSENDKSIVLLGETIRLEISRAVSECENFMSQVFRLRATTTNNEYRCFIKVLPQKAELRDVARKLELYQREITMFSEVFPYLRNKLIQVGLNPSEYLMVPHLYHSNLGLNNNGLPTSKTIFASEDLALRGFRMTDKRQGCDLNEAKCALRSLAYFHALSNVMLRETRNQRENFDFLQIFTKKDAPESKPSTLSLMKQGLRCSADATALMGYKNVAEKLYSVAENVAEHYSRKTEEESGILACLIHGDYWNNNMLFQYDEQSGLPLATAMVDWQLPSVGHPAKDIAYFFVTSTRKSLWKDHWNELLHSYYGDLSHLLSKLGFDLEASGYTEATFLEEFAERFVQGIPQGIVALPVMLSNEIGAEMQKNEGSLRDFHEEHDETASDAADLTPEAQENFTQSTPVEILVANQAWRDVITDLFLELIDRNWC